MSIRTYVIIIVVNSIAQSNIFLLLLFLFLFLLFRSLLFLSQAYLKGFSKLTPSLRCEGIQQLVGKSMPILEAHAVVKKIDRLLDQTVGPNGAKYKKILENLEPVVIG